MDNINNVEPKEKKKKDEEKLKDDLYMAAIKIAAENRTKEQQDIVDFYDKIVAEKNSIEKTNRNNAVNLDNHARQYSGYHDYDGNAFVGKQNIKDLAEQYRVFFEGDTQLRTFIDAILHYTEIDTHSTSGYDEEVEFIKTLPLLLEETEKYIYNLQQQHIDKLNRMTKEEFEAMPKAKQDAYNKKMIKEEETLDNCLRAVANIGHYLETMLDGKLDEKAYKNVMEEFKGQIEEADKKDYSFNDLRDENGKFFYYINASGIEPNKEMDSEGMGAVESTMVFMGKNTTVNVDRSDVPLFPHEPRYTDVTQAYSGECYLYSALGELARLYPWKIKNMIKDNGDGTCTVRFYARGAGMNGMEYTPVYVRVSKSVPKLGLGAFDRLGKDCMWVNMIEKAYALSGLHYNSDKGYVLPVNFSREDEKRKPSIAGIEGGYSANFMETILGEEGKSKVIPHPEGNGDFEIAQYIEQINNYVDKGVPMFAGSRAKKQDVNFVFHHHAYAIIGTVKTENPTKYFLRIKNPHTKNVKIANGMEYTQDKNGDFKGKWVNLKDGIFDMELSEFLHDFEPISCCGDGYLSKQDHRKTEDYEVTSDYMAKEYEKKWVTASKLSDIMKVSNDLYDAMVATNFTFSNDSKQYTELLEGLKDFRMNVALSRGKKMDALKEYTKTLNELVKAYEDHVAENPKPSTRQKNRLSVCESVKILTDCIDNAKSPEAEIGKKYAEKLMNQSLKNAGFGKHYLKEYSGKLYNNRAFKDLVNKNNVHTLLNADKKMMNEHLKVIEKQLVGRGIDNKGVNMTNMNPKQNLTKKL